MLQHQVTVNMYEKLNKGIDSVMDCGPPHYTVIMDDFNAKVGSKVGREIIVEDQCINSRSGRGKTLIIFVECYFLKIMHTLLDKNEAKNGYWKVLLE